MMQMKCLERMPPHLPPTYHELGAYACGNAGRAIVTVVTTLEYFGYACMQLILLWHQVEVSKVSSSTNYYLSLMFRN